MSKFFGFLLSLFFVSPFVGAGGGSGSGGNFPPALNSYGDAEISGLVDIIVHRIGHSPFNLAALIIFFCAIIHTFMTSRFLAIAHHHEHRHKELIKQGKAPKGSVSLREGVFHFLGEVEVVFGMWGIALVGAIFYFYDWHTAVEYLTHKVNFTEPLFVIVIMALASTRPILKLAEMLMERIAGLMGGQLKHWWLTLLTVGPVLGSFITEPAAMTITALLLSQKFYDLGPRDNFKYMTLGLLFVNISVGGTLTHFAAPPVLMVAAPWDWGMSFMMSNFGWKAVIGIIAANFLYFSSYKDELARLQNKFDVLRLEYELRNHFMNEDELGRIFDDIELVLNDELGFKNSFDAKCAELKDELRIKIIEGVVEREVDHLTEEEIANLFEKYFDKVFKGFNSGDMRAYDRFEWAFEKRFEEIKLSEMRKTLPGLLPESLRVPYRDPDWDHREAAVPAWIILVHLLFMGWTVFTAHYPALFLGGFLFFLGFSQVTVHYQNRLDLKPPLLVGFFLAGLVVHGGVQGWWIAPVLSSLGEVPLMVGATVLTAFNDNAAITYLATLVPNFTDELKYAVVAGAVTGGGLTVIANAPNPAGVSILKHHFTNGISPLGLLKASLIPTVIMGLCFMLVR
ncbi:MAG: putative Na+/H+ antiporter [Acidobacteriota bacterium]|nr:putative Na+/H+ antiporter [Acidobacteriota bacterium]